MHDTSSCSGTALVDTVSGDFNLSPPSLLPRTPEVPNFSHSNMCSLSLGFKVPLQLARSAVPNLHPPHPANQTPERRPLCHSYIVV